MYNKDLSEVGSIQKQRQHWHQEYSLLEAHDNNKHNFLSRQSSAFDMENFVVFFFFFFCLFQLVIVCLFSLVLIAKFEKFTGSVDIIESSMNTK